MANEDALRDKNHVTALLAVTDDSNQYTKMLRIDDSTKGVLVTLAGGGTSPGGNNTDVQFNDSGSFGGDDDFTWNKTTKVLTLGGTGVTDPTIQIGTGYGLITNSDTFLDFDSGSSTFYIDPTTVSFSSTGTGEFIIDNSILFRSALLNFNATSGLYNLRSGLTTGNYAKLDASAIASTDKTFTFPNVSGNVAVTSGTLFIASGKTFTVNNTLTLAGTDSTVMTFPTTSATIARTDAANTFTGASTASAWVLTSPTITTKLNPTSDDGAPLGDTTHNWSDLFLASGAVINIANSNWVATHTSAILTIGTGTLKITTPTNTSTSVVTIDGTQTLTNKSIVASQVTTGTFGTGAYVMDTKLTIPQVITTANAITASSNAATIPVTSANNIVTNDSAGNMTITLTTTSAVNMQKATVQILDFSAVAKTITWVNTENSTITAPATSNGSTSLPLTVGFIYNSSTSKWRCVASA